MKRKLVAVMVPVIVAMCLVACGNHEDVSNVPEQESVEISVSSEEISEEISVVTEEVSEEVSEEASEEEEVDYSLAAIEARINEIVEAYPNEDSRQIAAVVIGTNVKYMTDEEIEEVLNAYEFSKEEVNQLFMDYFAMKAEVINTLHQITEGATFDEVPDYLAISPIYVYCLNPHEYDECYKLEEGYKKCVESNISPVDNEYANTIRQDDGNPSIARMLTIVRLITGGFKEFEEYDECIPFADEYAKTLEQ